MSATKRGPNHGMSGTPTYKSWAAMIVRCTNPKSLTYRLYGARGITVCPAWKKFKNFFADMGIRPEGMTIDRIDSKGNYEPSNCRWATNRVQRLNSTNVRWITFNGERKCLQDWCEYFGVKHKTAWTRLSRGESFETAFDPKTHQGVRR